MSSYFVDTTLACPISRIPPATASMTAGRLLASAPLCLCPRAALPDLFEELAGFWSPGGCRPVSILNEVAPQTEEVYFLAGKSARL